MQFKIPLETLRNTNSPKTLKVMNHRKQTIYTYSCSDNGHGLLLHGSAPLLNSYRWSSPTYCLHWVHLTALYLAPRIPYFTANVVHKSESQNFLWWTSNVHSLLLASQLAPAEMKKVIWYQLKIGKLLPIFQLNASVRHHGKHQVGIREPSSLRARGGRTRSRDSYNWHSKIKKYGCKLNEWLYGRHSNGCNGHARLSTKLNISGSWNSLPWLA